MQNMFQPIPTTLGQVDTEEGGDMFESDQFNETFVFM